MGNKQDTPRIVRFGAIQRLGTALIVAVVAFLMRPNSVSRHTN